MQTLMRRPSTIQEVAERAKAGGRIDPLIREFLDQFYLGTVESRMERVAVEPALVSPRVDAYLAAVTEHLCLRFNMPAPDWTEAPGRFLPRPFFAGGLEGLKATLLAESPLAFRRRQIFVSANALARPRDPSTPNAHGSQDVSARGDGGTV